MNDFCKFCGGASDKICLCDFPPTSLCLQCRDSHETKSKSLSHTYLPAALKAKIGSREVLDEAKEREFTFAKRKRELMSEVQHMDGCIGEVEAVFHDLQEKVAEIREKLLLELHQRREEANLLLEVTFSNINEHLFDTDYDPEDALTQQIWLQEALTLRPFRYQVRPLSAVLALVADLVTVSWSSLSMSVTAPLSFVSANALRTFSLQSGTWSALPLSQEIGLSKHSSLVVFDQAKLFVCGNNPATALNCLITCSSGAVQPLPDTLRARNLPGLAVVQKSTYIFGGKDERGIVINVCEKRRERDWTQLPHSGFKRWGFNPCVAGSKIYLLGGEPQSGSEAFDTASQTFTKLQLELPKGFSSCISTERDILIVTNSEVRRWTVDSGLTEIQCTPVSRLPANCSGSAGPVLAEGKVYVLQAYLGVLHVVDVATLTYSAILVD